MLTVQLLVIIALAGLSLVLIVLAGVSSPPGNLDFIGSSYNGGSSAITTPPVQGKCNYNLAFNYTTQTTPIKAPIGQVTFDTIFVTNEGNVTENVSLAVSPQSGAPFTVKVANTTAVPTTPSHKTIYTTFGVYTPTRIGNYTATVTILSAYAGCTNSTSYTAHIDVVNGS